MGMQFPNCIMVKLKTSPPLFEGVAELGLIIGQAAARGQSPCLDNRPG